MTKGNEYKQPHVDDIIFVGFLGLAFLRKKNRSFCLLMLFSKNVFIIIGSKFFDDNLNFELILAPGCEFLSAKCAQFPLTFTK